MTKEMKELIDKYWDEDKHDKIVEMIMAVPEAERDIDMLGQLVVAYNNLYRYDDAINLSMELKEESVENPSWYYRIGYAYVKKQNYQKAADYLETGMILANQKTNINCAKSCQKLYEQCMPHIQKSKKGKKIEIRKMNYINLNDYKKSIFVYGMTEAEVFEKIKRYEEIASGGKQKVTIKLKYFTISKDWIFIDYMYADDFEDWNFWHYQNLLLWLADGENNSFCFAYKEIHTYENAFYSHANISDQSGASVIGLFKGAEFYYEVPGFYLDWFSEEDSCILNSDTLYSYRHIDASLLENMEKCEWKEIEIVVSD